MRAPRQVGHLIVATSLLASIAIVGARAKAQNLAKNVAPWNMHAIESSFAGMRVREIDPSTLAVIFLYDLDNRTDTDYQLSKGPSIMVMSRLKSSGSLISDRPVTLNASAFVPAKNRTRIELEVRRPFLWPARMDPKAEGKFRDLIAAELADLEGFVLFDGSTRYEVSLPGTWPDIQKTVIPIDRH